MPCVSGEIFSPFYGCQPHSWYSQNANSLNFYSSSVDPRAGSKEKGIWILPQSVGVDLFRVRFLISALGAVGYIHVHVLHVCGVHIGRWLAAEGNFYDFNQRVLVVAFHPALAMRQACFASVPESGCTCLFSNAFDPLGTSRLGRFLVQAQPSSCCPLRSGLWWLARFEEVQTILFSYWLPNASNLTRVHSLDIEFYHRTEWGTFCFLEHEIPEQKKTPLRTAHHVEIEQVSKPPHLPPGHTDMTCYSKWLQPKSFFFFQK